MAEVMFQNVAYRATVYRTGVVVHITDEKFGQPCLFIHDCPFTRDPRVRYDANSFQ